MVGANVHDSRLIELTLKDTCAMGGHFKDTSKGHLCLDKEYDYKRVSVEVYVTGFEEYIRIRNEEKQERAEGIRPHRWGVERTFAWLKGFRSLRIRY